MDIDRSMEEATDTDSVSGTADMTGVIPEGGACSYQAGSSSGSGDQANPMKPICVIVLGMAGSGKTSFVQVNML